MMITVSAAYGKTLIGNCDANGKEIIKISKELETDIIVFPELSVTGYTCGDLFHQESLLANAKNTIIKIAYETRNLSSLIFVGAPLNVNGYIENCAFAINYGKVIGIVPKKFKPNYKEFYEKRWFNSNPKNQPEFVDFYCSGQVPYGRNILFKHYKLNDLKVGVEICEDLWVPIPPSCWQSMAGALVIVNLSASNETVGKSDYRKNLVENQSGRCIGAYIYSSCGPTESTSDLVFGGDCIIAENGSVIARTHHDGIGFDSSSSISANIDCGKLRNERSKVNSFFDEENNNVFREITFYTDLQRVPVPKLVVNKFPFIPSDKNNLDKRCKEILDIQVSGLSQRMLQIGENGKFTIGVSGGLDSTLALLVACMACEKLGWTPKIIQAVTMPGFGTTNSTKSNAIRLMTLLGVSQETISIKEICKQMFKDINHKPFGLDPTNKEFEEKLSDLPPNSNDLIFENVQARARTFILMSKGFVIGTGDMSELALGWATYNGDHMSMYNPNCSVPKTLIKFLVNYIAETKKGSYLEEVLKSILNTTISPELLPINKDGNTNQSTEDTVGPYSLHDFFLFHFVRNSFSPIKILRLAENAFSDNYTKEEIKKWLRIFITRFFKSQFKRNCVPDGPKVGSVSLSPRGDWRMPSDADYTQWIKELDNV